MTGKSRLYETLTTAEASIVFLLITLCNNTSSVKQPIPKFRSGNGRREEPKLVMKTTKKRVKVGANSVSICPFGVS